MSDFNIKEHSFRTVRKLDARKQFHLARRLGPMFLEFAKAGDKISFIGDAPDLDDVESIQALSPLARGLADLEDSVVDFIIDTCLSVCQLRQDINGKEVWANLMVNGQLMFDTVDMALMVQIVMHVVQENLGNFLNGPTSSAAIGASAPKT